MEDYSIDRLFPVSIYRKENVLEQEELDNISTQCLKLKETVNKGGDNWRSSPYNTMGTFDLRDHTAFEKIARIVTKRVNDFGKMQGSGYEYKCTDSWFNVYYKHDYQEYHTHNEDMFSAIVYIKSPEGSGRTFFKAPFDQRHVHNMFDVNELNNDVCAYNPIPGNLLIFRSYIPHMVEQSLSDEPRISLEFNFN